MLKILQITSKLNKKYRALLYKFEVNLFCASID